MASSGAAVAAVAPLHDQTQHQGAPVAPDFRDPEDPRFACSFAVFGDRVGASGAGDSPDATCTAGGYDGATEAPHASLVPGEASAAQQFFRRHGFVVLRGVLSRTEVAAARREAWEVTPHLQRTYSTGTTASAGGGGTSGGSGSGGGATASIQAGRDPAPSKPVLTHRATWNRCHPRVVRAFQLMYSTASLGEPPSHGVSTAACGAGTGGAAAMVATAPRPPSRPDATLLAAHAGWAVHAPSDTHASHALQGADSGGGGGGVAWVGLDMDPWLWLRGGPFPGAVAAPSDDATAADAVGATPTDTANAGATPAQRGSGGGKRSSGKKAPKTGRVLTWEARAAHRGMGLRVQGQLVLGCGVGEVQGDGPGAAGWEAAVGAGGDGGGGDGCGGCLAVVPGFHSHLEAWVASHHDATPPTARAQQPLRYTFPRDSEVCTRAVRVPARAGSLVLWDQRLPHGATPHLCRTPAFAQPLAMFPPRHITKRWRRLRSTWVRAALGRSGLLATLTPLGLQVLDVSKPAAKKGQAVQQGTRRAHSTGTGGGSERTHGGGEAGKEKGKGKGDGGGGTGSGSGAAGSAAPTPEEEEAYWSTLVQYIVIPKDLYKMKNFSNKGAVLTQAAHACTAVIWAHREDPFVQKYLSPKHVNDMHKIALQVKTGAELVDTARMLADKGIDHKLWIEQPENIPTCIATKPYPRRIVAPILRGLRLLR